VSDPLLVVDRGRVRVLTLNRPEKRNAFDQGLYRATGEALTAALADDGVRAVVLTGNGPVFCAGQDLDEMARLGQAARSGKRTGVDGRAFQVLLDAAQSFEKPLLAAVNGHGIGVGCTILAHCDLVLIAGSARLRTPFAELGVTAEAGSTYLFPLRMGWQRAAAVLLAGEWLTAQDAVDAGLAYRVVADDEVLDETVALADRIAHARPESVRSIKRLMLRAHLDQVKAARAAEEADFATLLETYGAS
jgi:enoyl-CoA hydratase/carnithine racemase